MQGMPGLSFLNGLIATYAYHGDQGYHHGGYGGGGNGSFAGAGGGGGYTGGGSHGQWSTYGINGGGGGSLVNTDYSGSITTATTGTVDKQTSPSGVHGHATITYQTIQTTGTLVSVQSAAETAPTKADLVLLIEDVGGTPGVINTDLIAYIGQSATATPAYTSALTLVDEGDWGTNKRIFVARDVTTGLSGVNMNYKLSFANQSNSKNTKIHSASLGWS